MKSNHSSSDVLTRRGFLRASGGAAGLAGLAACSTLRGKVEGASRGRGLVSKGDVILFQGDSITDMGRSRQRAGEPNEQAAMGNGYAWLAAVELLVDRPDDGLKIFNRGISGNKVFQLADRWQTDCLDLKPDLLSILVGVNDYWHTIDKRINYQGTVQIYERDYRHLLERTVAALPKVKLVICEPYVLRCGVVNSQWFPEFDHYRAAARRVAEAFRATFIPFQAMFDKGVAYARPEDFSHDGVHPVGPGASLMAHNWLEAVHGLA
jgi:lysophospholipase L1-like esterase